MNPANNKEALPMSSIGSTGSIVRAVDVRKSYGDFKALQGITLDIPKGEVLCVIGPSGSGKSTFLRCINQLEEINDGALWVNGERVGYRRVGNKLYALSEKQVARQRLATGMVFQRFNLFPHKTVLENVIEGPVQVLKRRRPEAIEEARALLERVGLAHKCEAFPVELSGGQQQRVAIARALAMHPQLMLFDEPTSALDPELVGEVLEVIRRLAIEDGLTMIISTHQLRFADEVADRVVFLSGGSVVEEGPAHEVLTRPRHPLTARFLSVMGADSRLEVVP
jgi:polar amino acid transport system ATP-binding protein